MPRDPLTPRGTPPCSGMPPCTPRVPLCPGTSPPTTSRDTLGTPPQPPTPLSWDSLAPHIPFHMPPSLPPHHAMGMPSPPSTPSAPSTWGTPSQSSACCMASRAFSTGWLGSQLSQSGHRPGTGGGCQMGTRGGGGGGLAPPPLLGGQQPPSHPHSLCSQSLPALSSAPQHLPQCPPPQHPMPALPRGCLSPITPVSRPPQCPLSQHGLGVQLPPVPTDRGAVAPRAPPDPLTGVQLPPIAHAHYLGVQFPPPRTPPPPPHRGHSCRPERPGLCRPASPGGSW